VYVQGEKRERVLRLLNAAHLHMLDPFHLIIIIISSYISYLYIYVDMHIHYATFCLIVCFFAY